MSGSGYNLHHFLLSRDRAGGGGSRSTEFHQEHLGVPPQDLEPPRENDDIADIASVLVESSPVLD